MKSLIFFHTDDYVVNFVIFNFIQDVLISGPSIVTMTWYNAAQSVAVVFINKIEGVDPNWPPKKYLYNIFH